MKNVQRNRGKLYRDAALILVLLCFALVVNQIFGNHGWLALRRQKKEFESLQQKIQALQQENQQLEEQIRALKSDPKAIEKQAREQLRLARPGELIFTLPEKNPQPQPPAVPTQGKGNR